MKRLTKIFMLVMLITILASSTVSAHSGGTDSEGGHTDSSTGEYHYHHGYPAHQHTDTDGDGILECPYTIKNDTQSSSSNSTSTKQNIAKILKDDSQPSTNSKNNSQDSVKTIVETEYVTEYITEYKLPKWAIWTAVVLGIVILGLYADNGDQRTNVKRLQSQLDQARSELDSIKRSKKEAEARIIDIKQKAAQDLCEQVSKFQTNCVYILQKHGISEPLSDDPESLYVIKQIKDVYSDEFLLEYAHAPKGAQIGKDNLPRIDDNTQCKWGKAFTLFYNPSTGKYHSCGCRHSLHCTQINVAKVASLPSFDKCNFCNPIIPDLKWYYKFLSMKTYVDQVVNFQRPITPKMLKIIIQENK